jgi:hypothetical protein
MNHKEIYLVFTRTGTWLSRLICIFSRIKYPHVSISFDDSFTRMYSFGRRSPDNPFSGGLVEENLQDGVFRKFPDSQCRIYRIEVSEEQFRLIRAQIKAFLKEKEKYRYNFLGLFGVITNRPVKRKNRYFCSQFVSHILMNAGVFHGNKAPELTRPDDLLAIDNKRLVYEGPVMGFRNVPSFRSGGRPHRFPRENADDIPFLPHKPGSFRTT